MIPFQLPQIIDPERLQAIMDARGQNAVPTNTAPVAAPTVPTAPTNTLTNQQGMDILNQAYQKNFGRDVKQPGKDAYLPKLLSGEIDAARLQDILAASDERQEYLAKLRDPHIPNTVHETYVENLGRTPEPAGFQFYVDRLRSGQLTPEEFANQVANSPEGRAYMAEQESLYQAPGEVLQPGQVPLPGQVFGLDQFEADPGYQFRLSEGEKAIRRSAAAGSGVHSGATLKALQRHGQNLASDEYARARGRAVEDYQLSVESFMRELGLEDRARGHAYQDQAYADAMRTDYWNRLMQLAGLGGDATSQAAQIAGQTGSAYSNAAQYGVEGVGAARLGAANTRINSAFAKQQNTEDILDGITDIIKQIQLI